MSGYHMICCVVNMGDAEKTIRSAVKYGVKAGTVSIGRGTVHSHLLHMLGLHEVRKEIVKLIAEDALAPQVIQGISRDMSFDKPHHGIAFTMPVREFADGGNNFETGKEKDCMYKAIHVVVDKGDAEDIIDAANAAGARGATVLNARGVGLGETQTFFHMEIVPEKEEVLIITTAELKDTIVDAIRKQIKPGEPGATVAHGP